MLVRVQEAFGQCSHYHVQVLVSPEVIKQLNSFSVHPFQPKYSNTNDMTDISPLIHSENQLAVTPF